MQQWTTSEIGYLERHAHEGAAQVARGLGRSVESVRQQAKHYGISLRRRWFCPNCGNWVHRPLSERTGWCAACTKARNRARLERELLDMQREAERERSEDRARQAIYSQKNRLRKKSTNR